jgi:hypothetical protein
MKRIKGFKHSKITISVQPIMSCNFRLTFAYKFNKCKFCQTSINDRPLPPVNNDQPESRIAKATMKFKKERGIKMMSYPIVRKTSILCANDENEQTQKNRIHFNNFKVT